ncbi:MAG: hypothetical protein M5R41_10390 [Bacteroidia bacterium]|nr:hypothetical protein [Bacteroidia bacterium]
MPFTSPDLLKTTLGESAVASFVAAKPDVLEALITTADSVMTTASGIEAPDDPAAQTGNEQMLLYAAWIVSYLMLPHLGIRDDDEVSRRRANYDRAVRELKDLRGRPTAPGFTRPTAQYATTERTGEIL